MNIASRKTKESIADEITRLSGRSENRTFLRNLKHFEVDKNLPDTLRDLLAKLEAVERRSLNRPAAAGR